MILGEQEVSTRQERYGLPSGAWQRLIATFHSHPAVERVTLYGSRANGNYRHNSDIDLMVSAPGMDWAAFNNLERDIDDLLLPWKVDLALRHHVENADLLDHVARVGVVVFPTIGRG